MQPKPILALRKDLSSCRSGKIRSRLRRTKITPTSRGNATSQQTTKSTPSISKLRAIRKSFRSIHQPRPHAH
uniref:Uncharacterized protein n=1 Tax=Romanomermis culicivorax TaxID=13658 RepID=A0A915KMH4_ROMCU